MAACPALILVVGLFFLLDGMPWGWSKVAARWLSVGMAHAIAAGLIALITLPFLAWLGRLIA